MTARWSKSSFSPATWRRSRAGGNFHDRGDALISFTEIELDGCGVACPFRQAAFDQFFMSRQPPAGKDGNVTDMDDDIETEVD